MFRIHVAVILLGMLLLIPGVALGLESDLNTSSITLERGMCFGTCPVYSLILSGNGSVIYDGQMYVKEIGSRNGTINVTSFRYLLDQFTDAGFFRMKDQYTAYDITDMPSAVLTVITGNHTWRVDHYYGDHSAPGSLSILEDAVDQAANVTRWTEPYREQEDSGDLWASNVKF